MALKSLPTEGKCAHFPSSSTVVVPSTFGTREWFCGRQFFQRWDGSGGNGFRMIQVHYIYYVLYFDHYDISSTSDHQALDPRGW